MRPVGLYHDEMLRLRKMLIARALAEHQGNRTRAARTLGIQRTYLCRLVREFGFHDPTKLAAAGGAQ